MKKIFLLLAVVVSFTVKAQTITFNGCHALFENQDYIFNKETTDVSGRNVFTTTPVDGGQSCGGLGTCEFKIQWSAANSRWEFVADSGNGDFVNPHLIYYNTSASTPNPPDLTLGSWIENTVATSSACGGVLTSGNAVLTGAVQSTVLGTADFSINGGVIVYPNPSSEHITVLSKSEIKNLSILNMQGQVVLKAANSNVANVAMLQNGVYLLRLDTDEGVQVLNFVKK